MHRPFLAVRNIQHAYHDEHGKHMEILHAMHFSIEKGSFISLIGPSGCGKSTMLRIIAGLMKPDKGEILSQAKKTAMVFQNFALFPWLTVYENIEFGLKMENVPYSARHKIVVEKIHEARLTGAEHKYPKELSGGMCQRVGIARALAVSPDLLLMDEPFSSLDSLTAQNLRADVLALWNKYKMTVLMVTHLIEEAIEMSERIFVLKRAPSHIVHTEDIHLSEKGTRDGKAFMHIAEKLREKIEHAS